MLYEALEILKDQVSEYLETTLGDAGLVVLDNIGKVDDPDIATMNDKIVLSLLSVQEEITLKNVKHHTTTNNTTIYKNAPIHLNVYVLFSANRTYVKSVKAIGSLIEFFQSKHVFTQTNTPLNPSNTALNEIKEFKFSVELFTPSFEQLNYIWGTLGGKSLPCVMYRLSLVRIDSDRIQEQGPAIQQITQHTKTEITT